MMENRDYVLHVRLTDAERTHLRELAEKTDQSLSAVARQALMGLVTKPEADQQECEEVAQ
jgi:predicted transcriptional regulator